MPQTGGCKGVASIRLAFLRPTSTSSGFMSKHIQPPWRLSFKYFPLMVSFLSIPLLGGFLLIPTRILQIVTVASLYIMFDVYSKRYEEPFRESPFSLDYLFSFFIGSYILLLVSFIMRLQNEDFAIRQRVAEKGVGYLLIFYIYL